MKKPFLPSGWDAAWLVPLIATVCTVFARAATVEFSRLDTLLMLPHKPSTHDPPAYISSAAHRVAIVKDIVYLADGYAGLNVYSLSDPSNPSLVGSYQTGEYARRVEVRGNRVYVMDSLDGPVVFDASDPMKLRRLENSEVTVSDAMQAMQDGHSESSIGPSSIVAVVDHQLYISRADLGVVVIRMHAASDVPPGIHKGVITYRTVKPEPAWPAGRQLVRIQLVPNRAETGVQVQSAAVSLDGDLVPSAEGRVAGSPATAKLELTASTGAGDLKLWISGPAGQTVRVQRSATLGGDWTDWQTITLGNAPTELTDEEAAGAEQSFYRAVSP